jgi:hypothetical protein
MAEGWVCSLQLLLVLARAVILMSESRGTHDHILHSQIRESPNLEGQVPVFISPQEKSGPVIPPGTEFCLRIRCGENVYSEPLPSNERLFSLR